VNTKHSTGRKWTDRVSAKNHVVERPGTEDGIEMRERTEFTGEGAGSDRTLGTL